MNELHVKDMEHMIDELDPRTHEMTREWFDGVDPEKAETIANYRAEANRLAMEWALSLRDALVLYQTRTKGNGDEVEDKIEDTLVAMIAADLPGSEEVQILYKELDFAGMDSMDTIEAKVHYATLDAAKRILHFGS